MNANNDNLQVLLDGVFFQYGSTGIARLWTALLHEWSATPFAQQLLVLDRGDTAPRIDGIRYRSIPAYDHRTTGEDAARLQTLCDEERADVFVSTYYTAPLTTPSVFVAYDMIPEVYAHELDSAMWREKHYGIQHASAYFAISHSTARDLTHFFPELDGNAVVVAHPGVTANFHPSAASEIEQFRERRVVNKPYFLLVGSRAGFNGYKNAMLFFRSFAQLPGRECFAILCAGGESTLEEAFQPFVKDVEVHLVHLSDDELRTAYSGAVALAYPSRYEGFGLPVLEALACGCPVITCRNSSLVEVTGDAALFTPEDDVTAMIAALQQVQQDEMRESLIAAGLRQATQFSWRSMAAALSDVLRHTAAKGPRPSRIWPEFRRLQVLAQEREALGWQLRHTEDLWRQNWERYTESQAELAKTRQESLQTEMELREKLREVLAEKLQESQFLLDRIAQMETSKFWKMRNAYIDSKTAMLRLAQSCLPRRAG